MYLFVPWHDAQRGCLCSGAFPKPRPVPRDQTWNEDKTYSLHVTTPSQKHFVVPMCRSRPTLSSTDAKALVVCEELRGFGIGAAIRRTNLYILSMSNKD